MQKELTITNPDMVNALYHEKRMKIMKILIERPANIIELSKITKINPGTIKRHLDILLKGRFIELLRIDINEYGIKVKYYSAVAQKFSFIFRWP